MFRSLLSDFEPVRRAVLGELKPTEIISLTQAITLPTTSYKRSYYL